MEIRIPLLAALCLGASAVACGGNTVRPTPRDGAVDDAMFDGGPTPDEPVPTQDVVVDTRVPRCGDTVLDPGESCDDGNNADGDGCSARCRFEARCGDMRVDMGEVCDDGNNRSGDGCRSDCLSNETCGNRLVDTARGEVCDGTPNCAMDCRSVLMCGNGRVDMGEQCDDSNMSRWDGCGPDCRTEQAVVVTRFSFAPDNGMVGCDFSGDRMPDNAFGRALGPGAGILNSVVSSPISNGQVLIQLSFLNLTDPRGQNVSDTRVGWLYGTDGDTELINNSQPGNPQYINRGSVDGMTMLPQASFQSRIVNGALTGGPEDVQLNLGMGGMFDFRVLRGRISGTVVADDNRITEVRDPVLCGALAMRDLARLPNPIGLILGRLGGGGGGGTMMNQSSFLELVVGGQTIPLVNIRIGPQQPDIDLDGDGLERIEANMGSIITPPRVTACIDGNGTRIEGRECINDPRIADGYTVAFQMATTWITLRGIR